MATCAGGTRGVARGLSSQAGEPHTHTTGSAFAFGAGREVRQPWVWQTRYRRVFYTQVEAFQAVGYVCVLRILLTCLPSFFFSNTSHFRTTCAVGSLVLELFNTRCSIYTCNMCYFIISGGGVVVTLRPRSAVHTNTTPAPPRADVGQGGGGRGCWGRAGEGPSHPTVQLVVWEDLVMVGCPERGETRPLIQNLLPPPAPPPPQHTHLRSAAHRSGGAAPHPPQRTPAYGEDPGAFSFLVRCFCNIMTELSYLMS